jgi:DHA2 family multidrug resistance protein
MNPAIAHQQALMVMDRMVSAQASVLAFSRIYLLSGLALCFSVPLMLFWQHGKGRAAVQAH